MNINEIGILALGTRMKQLYEFIAPEVKMVYQAHGIDFDPKWFTIVYTLVEEKEMSVTDLSKALGQSHPSVIQNLRELEKNNWIISSKSKKDGRIRLIRLSEEAHQKTIQLQKIWGYMRQAIEEINQEGQSNFWEGFQEMESAIMKRSWRDRVMEISAKDQKSTLRQDIQLPYKWFDREFNFEQLNTTPEGLIERLRFTPLRLGEQVKNLTKTQLTKSSNDKWSIQQNIGHLNDLEPLWYGRILDIINGEAIMRAADLNNTKSHEADHDQVPIQNILSSFTANRKKLIRLCETHFDRIISASALHPRLMQPMRMIDLLYFVAEHDDHHLATNRFLMDL